MSNIKRTLFALGAFFVLFVSAAGASYAQNNKPTPSPTPTPSTSNVNVVNTPNVNVANTPSVTVANTPSVSITNVPDVKVTNTPRTLNANDLQPYQRMERATTTGTDVFFAFYVPKGKRLVIEYISARATTASGEEADAAITTVTAPDYLAAEHQIVLSPQRKTTNNNYFAGAQQVRIYQEGESDFGVVVTRSNSAGGSVAGEMRVVVSISGYLVDVQ